MKCELCNSRKRDDVRYGEFLQKDGKAVHTFCLYLTSNLCQNGKDDQGFLGFLFADIAAERDRVALQKCYYCGKGSANISCCKPRCYHAYHLTCGIEHGVNYQFIKTFRSFCHMHVPKVPSRPCPDEICCICYDALIGEGERFSKVNMLLASCCRNGWFHKYCLQRFANTAAYFFKCPLCNDSNVFRERMSYMGIFIPERDAAWELEPHAYEELLERPSVCTALQCRNQAGRAENDDDDPLLMCRSCGSVARHQKCLPLQTISFECTDCQQMLGDDSGRESEENARPNGAENSTTEQFDGAIELDVIDVENTSDECESDSECDGGYDFMGIVLSAIEDIKRGDTVGNEKKSAQNNAAPCTGSTRLQQHGRQEGESASNASNLSCITNCIRESVQAMSNVTHRTRNHHKSISAQHSTNTSEDVSSDTDIATNTPNAKEPPAIILPSNDSEPELEAYSSSRHVLCTSYDTGLQKSQATAAISDKRSVHLTKQSSSAAHKDTENEDTDTDSESFVAARKRPKKYIESSSGDSDIEQSHEQLSSRGTSRGSHNIGQTAAKKRKHRKESSTSFNENYKRASNDKQITDTHIEADDIASQSSTNHLDISCIANRTRRRSDIHGAYRKQNQKHAFSEEQCTHTTRIEAVEDSTLPCSSISSSRSTNNLDISCIAYRTRRRSNVRSYRKQNQSTQANATPTSRHILCMRDTSINYYPLKDISEEEDNSDDDDEAKTAAKRLTTPSLQSTNINDGDSLSTLQTSSNSSASTAHSPHFHSCNTTPSSGNSASAVRKRTSRVLIRRRFYSSEDDSDDLVMTSFAPRYNVDPYVALKYKRVNNKLKRVDIEADKSYAHRIFARSYNFLLNAKPENRHVNNSRH